MKTLVSLLLISSFLFLFGCGGATEFDYDAAKRKPITNTLAIGQIGFEKAISEIKPGTIIGGLYSGLVKKLRQEYYATGTIDEKYQRTYEEVINEELVKANYETVSKNVVFDTATTKPRFLIGASLLDARLNYYVVQSDNGLITYENNADAMLEIRWEFYDTQAKKIIYSDVELGTYRDAESDLFAYRECVRISFRNFLAEKKLVEELKKYLTQ